MDGARKRLICDKREMERKEGRGTGGGPANTKYRSFCACSSRFITKQSAVTRTERDRKQVKVTDGEKEKSNQKSKEVKKKKKKKKRRENYFPGGQSSSGGGGGA